MTISSEPKWRVFKSDGTPATWCGFCGANVNDVSERTKEVATAMYYCEGCRKNYCDQCSYRKKADGKQRCLRCETELEQLL